MANPLFPSTSKLRLWKLFLTACCLAIDLVAAAKERITAQDVGRARPLICTSPCRERCRKTAVLRSGLGAQKRQLLVNRLFLVDVLARDGGPMTLEEAMANGWVGMRGGVVGTTRRK
jgi:hypothetical protein